VRNAAEFSEALSRRFGQSAGTVEELGGHIRRAADNAATRFNARRVSLDDRAADLIGAGNSVDVGPVRALEQRLAAALDEAPASQTDLQHALGTVRDLIADADAAGGVLPYERLRAIRTLVGDLIAAPPTAAEYRTGANRYLSQLYGAINESLYQAAQEAGPEAARALRLHDRYVRMHRNVNLPMLDKILAAGTDADVYRIAMSNARNTGQQLRRLRNNMPAGEWDVVAATQVDMLGRALPGQQGATELAAPGVEFSISTFLTNWNKLAPEARRALFSGTRYAGIVPNLESFARVMEANRNAARTVNWSNTGRTLTTNALLFSVVGDLATGGGTISGAAAGGLIAGTAAAAMMTDPRAVRVMLRAGQGLQNNINPIRIMTGAAARLHAIASNERSEQARDIEEAATYFDSVVADLERMEAERKETTDSR
jgi:hypothetical protein